MEIVTGKRGFPHVSSYEMQTFQRGLVSDGDVLLDVGDKLNYTIVDNNTVRILSGAILMQGVYCIIPYGTYDEMYIDSIEPGKVRKDVIYAQYNRDLETGMEEVIMDVKKGTEVNTGETPVQPSFPSPVTPLWEGGSFAYVKLYEVTVTYNAISVAEILDRSRVLLTPLQSVGQGVGDTVNLNTTDKSNVVSAVNEVNGKANTNAGDIANLSSAMGTANGNITALQGRMTTAESDIDTLEGAVFSERKVYTERFATNITGNGRLMLMVSTWKKDTACVNVRFSNRVTGGFTDVVLMIKQNSYYTKCKQMYNDGIGISKIYRGSNNLTFDFEIPTSTNNAYDVYVTAPVWVSGTYGAQTSLSGTEMTIDRFDYNEMESTVGNLSNLSTTTHSNIVAAINEVNGRIVDTDYVITEYSVPYVSGNNAAFMIRSNEVAVVGDEEYLLNVEVIDSNGNAVEMLFLTTDDSVLNSKVVINQRPQTSNFEAIPISKIEDASSFISGNNAVLWITLEGTPDVTVRLTHHKSKTYTVVASPAMPSGTGRAINFVNGNTELYSTKNGSVTNYVSTKNGSVAIVSTSDATYDIAIINEGGQNPDIRIFTLQGDVNINGNYVGKTSLSGIGDGTITGAIAFSENDGEEVSGEVVTVTDAIDANAVGLSVDIEPVQEGSGTPSPTNVRPIHAVTESKNLFDKANVLNGYIADTTGEIISSSSGSKTAFVKVKAGVYTISKITSSVFRLARYSSQPTVGSQCISGSKLNVSSDATKYTYTINEDCWVGMFFVNGSSSSDVANSQAIIESIQVEKGSTATAYEPYHEPQIEIQRVGKNLFPYSQLTSSSASGLDINIPAGTYKLSFKRSRDTSPSLGISIRYYYDNGESIVVSGTSSFTAERTIVSLNYSLTNFATGDYLYDIQLEKGSTATVYESYQGETYIIKTGLNVYGGTLDATTGKMVVDKKFLSYTSNPSGGDVIGSYRRYSITLTDTADTTKLSDAICDSLENTGSGYSTDSAHFYIQSAGSNIFAFLPNDGNAYTINFVYEIATPQTINLTPQQVKMLKGTNTVSSNAQTLNLTYLKDNAVGKAVSIAEKEIEPQIEEIHNEIDTKLNTDSIAPVENGATASTSYAVGDYITRNNNLYKVISAISQGATFTSSNIQQITVTDIIKHKTVYYTNNIQTNDIFIPLFSSSEANRKGIVSVMLLDAYSMIPAYASVAGQVEYGGGGASSLSASISYHLTIASGQGIFNTGSYSVEVFYIEL